MGVPVRDLRGLTQQVQMISVEALDESSGGVSELLADGGAPDPMAVVQMYYLENRTLAEIGRLLGVTESRVCQLHSRLVGRLRGRLEEQAAG